MDKKFKNFFGSLYARCNSGSFIEFRPIAKNGAPKRREYLHIDDYRGIKKHCRLNRNYNCYFGVSTRDGKGGKKDNILQIPALWCDVDFKDIDRKEFRKKLKKFDFPPSITVFSGGGYHLYWILKKPIGRAYIPELEDMNRRIAKALNGDQNACDAARILRVPLTLNHKYRSPKTVRIKIIEPYEYELKDFLVLPKVKKRISKRLTKSNEGNWLIEAMRGVGKGERNAIGARIAGYFVNKLNKKDLLIIMRMWNCNNDPPLKIKELKGIVKSILRYGRSTSNDFQNNKTQNEKIRLSIK
jgi:hypothetical protein